MRLSLLFTGNRCITPNGIYYKRRIYGLLHSDVLSEILSLIVPSRNSLTSLVIQIRQPVTAYTGHFTWDTVGIPYHQRKPSHVRMKSRLFLSDDCFYSLVNWGQSATRVPTKKKPALRPLH